MARLAALADAIDRLTGRIGAAVSWLALFMVLVQGAIVLMRYVFGAGSVFLQESMLYMHGALFMLGAAATWMRHGHVRVDLFYRDLSPRRKAWVDGAGTVLFLIPFALTLWIVSWGYVVDSWATLEGSTEVAGIPARFLLKSTILAFAGLMLLQAIACLCRCTSLLMAPRDISPSGRA